MNGEEARWREWERRVGAILEDYGFEVQPFGQGTFDEPFRRALQRPSAEPARERWLPDWIATRVNLEGHRCLIYVDAKSEEERNLQSPRHTVSALSLGAGLEFEARGMRLYYLWPDLRIATPALVRAKGQWHDRDCEVCGYAHPSAHWQTRRADCLPADELLRPALLDCVTCGGIGIATAVLT